VAYFFWYHPVRSGGDERSSATAQRVSQTSETRRRTGRKSGWRSRRTRRWKSWSGSDWKENVDDQRARGLLAQTGEFDSAVNASLVFCVFWHFCQDFFRAFTMFKRRMIGIDDGLAAFNPAAFHEL